MKITVTKEWFRSRAHLEEGHEIGAGSLRHIGRPALRTGPVQPTVGNITFGQTIALLRRQRRWTIERLATEAEATSRELAEIEANPEGRPERSTVCRLAKVFRLPSQALLQKAGLADATSPVCAKTPCAPQTAPNSTSHSRRTRKTFCKRCSRRWSKTLRPEARAHPPARNPAKTDQRVDDMPAGVGAHLRYGARLSKLMSLKNPCRK